MNFEESLPCGNYENKEQLLDKSDKMGFEYKDHPYDPLKGSCPNPMSPSFLRNLRSCFGRKLNCQNLLISSLIFGVFLTYLNIRNLRDIIDNANDLQLSSGGRQIVPGGDFISTKEFMRKKRFALHGKRVDSGYLKHVIETFESFNYVRVPVESEWDVLWSHDYPFRVLKDRLSSLSSSHKVNHFPGSGYVTNKMELATSGLPYVPKAFQLPKQKEEFMEYAKQNPHKKFVQKSNNHRGIKIQTISSLDLTSNSSFIQEYISNPLLVDGHKFDIGMYTVLTSINPLRVYTHSEVLFRFCPEVYHPFDPDVVDKYVVGDDYLPIWKVPSLSKLYNDVGLGMKDTFDAWYRINKGKDPERIWAQVESAIRSIYLSKEADIMKSTKTYTGGSYGRNLFEMVRFDFVIDDDGNVYIMEANMSPNLSSAHFPPNQLLYRQVLHGLFKIVGISSSTKDASDTTQVSPKHLAVYPEECVSEKCLYACHDDIRCSLCDHCMNEEQREILRLAYLDDINKGSSMVRVFPPTERYNGSILKGTNLLDFQPEKGIQLTKENRQQVEWFKGKCKIDKSFCY